jgi:ABC-type transport system involved in multi-copper enzyme maturation permease subunit
MTMTRLTRLGPSLLVLRWSLAELLWRPRTLAMAALAATPLGLALFYRAALALRMTEAGPAEVFTSMVSGAFFPFVAPMLCLVYASGVVRDDLEAGTLPYFLTRPVKRSWFLLGKLAATFVIVLGLVLPIQVLVYYVVTSSAGFDEVGRRFPALFRTVGATALGLLAYNGVFGLAGTALKRPLLAGLFFIFGWQAAATFVPGRARLLTVAHYMSSLVPGGSGLLSDRSSLTLSVSALLAIAGGCHALAIAVFERKEAR